MAEDNKYSFGEDKVFRAGCFVKGEKRHVFWRYWRGENGDWNFIREITDVNAAFPEITEFNIPKEVMEHVIAQEAKKELNK